MNADPLPPAEVQFSWSDLNPTAVIDLLDRQKRTRCLHVMAGAPINGIICAHRTIRELCATCYRLEVGPWAAMEPQA